MDLNSTYLWTAIITPFKDDLSIDWEGYQLLLKQQEAAGNGVLVLGSTGEALNIDLENKKEIVEFTLEQNLNIPLMIGVGGHQFQATKNWVEWLNTKNIDALLMVTPIYAKPGAAGQYHWFKTLMDLSTKPVMLYNVPSRSGTALNHETVKKLANHEKLWAIKEASGSTEEFAKYLEDAPKAKVFSGDDGLTPDFCQLGGHGLVSVAANVWPEATNNFTKQCLEKRLKDKELWGNAADSLFMASNPVPAKKLLFIKKQIASDKLLPPLSEKDLTSEDQIQTLKRYDQEIALWNSKQ